MLKRALRLLIPYLIILLALASLAACRPPDPAPVTASAVLTAESTGTPVQLTPTDTPVPLAARVNGEGITLADFQAELQRYQSSIAEQAEPPSEEEQRQLVLDTLVDEALLSQAAVKNGFSLDEAALDARIATLEAQAGGAEPLKSWQEQNGYSPEGFRAALRRSAAAAWQRDQLAAGVPEAAEQVHAQQILLLDEETANRVSGRLEAGVEFATLARQYDPVTGGELGWFPAGYLLQPEVEAAAFALQPGEISQVVKSAVGFHILQVTERDSAHPLSPEARRALQRAALAQWLEDQRSQSEIEVLLPS